MKRSLWLLLVIVIVFVVASTTGFWRKTENPVIIETTKIQQVQPSKENSQQKTINIGEVSSAKLLAHIQNLNFRRYSDSERSHTRNYIISELRKFGWKPKLEKFKEGVNIFAERPGTQKDAGAILVAAHYDTVIVSPGADDNASGVAVVLEAARLLGSYSTPKTLQLALFDKEEEGLLGSKAFVSNKSHLTNLNGAIVMDMVAYACYTTGCQKYPEGLPVGVTRDRGDFLAAVADAEHSQMLNAFQNSTSANLPPVVTVPIPLKGLLTPDTLRSDHAPFWYQGIGAVLVTDTANLRTPHYHQPSDLPATIDREFFTGSAQVVVNAIAKLLDHI